MNISDGIDLAAYSMMNAQTQLMQDVGVGILAKTMETQAMQGDELKKMMEQSVNPSIGGNCDVML